MKNKRAFCPDRILSYFRAEWLQCGSAGNAMV